MYTCVFIHTVDVCIYVCMYMSVCAYSRYVYTCVFIHTVDVYIYVRTCVYVPTVDVCIRRLCDVMCLCVPTLKPCFFRRILECVVLFCDFMQADILGVAMTIV